MLKQAENKKCLACDKVVKGRSDKKFCDDYCRAAYNNELKSPTNNLVRNINNALSKNRRILEDCIPKGNDTGKTNQEKLLAKGFQFKYFTHTYTNKKGDIYFFCYDIGYLHTGDDWYLVVRRKEI